MTQATDRNLGEWLQYLNSILVRWVSQSAVVVADGADEMSSGEHTVGSCFKTASAFVDVALLNGAEYVETVLAGPGFRMLASVATSDWYAGPPNSLCTHSIDISPTHPLNRNVSNDPIASSRVSFEAKTADGGVEPCITGELPAGTAKFRVVVYSLGLHGGCYTGKVVLEPKPPGAGAPIYVDVDVEL